MIWIWVLPFLQLCFCLLEQSLSIPLATNFPILKLRKTCPLLSGILDILVGLK